MNIIRRLLIKVGLAKLKPHEKAELGIGTWGRQGQSSELPMLPAKTEPRATISARVIRKDGTIEDLGIISGGKE